MSKSFFVNFLFTKNDFFNEINGDMLFSHTMCITENAEFIFR